MATKKKSAKPTTRHAQKPAKAAKVSPPAPDETAAAPQIAEDPNEKLNLPSAWKLFKPSAEALRVNAVSIVGLTVTPVLASIPLFSIFIVLAMGAANTHPHPTAASTAVVSGAVFLAYLAMLFIGMIVGGGLTYTTVKAVRGEPVSYGESWSAGWRHILRFTGLSLLISLAVLVGLVLLIVPGVFLLRRYFLAPYYLIDRKLRILDAMDQSARDAKKYGGIWGVIGIMFLFALIAVIPAIGWLLSMVGIILFMCAPALRYQQMCEASGYRPYVDEAEDADPDEA